MPRIVIDTNDIERVTQDKLLGCTSSSDLTWNAHVDTIVSKARERVFTIYQLKRAGIRQCDLLRVYVSVIIPVLEYACPVWHTSLPKYLSDNIETIQKRCLRTIFPVHSFMTRHDQSLIYQLSLKDAPNCASLIFGKCTTLITS